MSAFAATLQRSYAGAAGAAASTIARRRSALASFYRYAVAADAIAGNPVGAPASGPRAASTTAVLDDAQTRSLLAAADRQGPKSAALVRLLLWGQSNGTVVIGAGLAITGLLMLSILGPQMLEEPWLLVALTIYFVNLGIAFFIQRPNLRRLIGIKAAPDDKAWLERAKRQRYVSYLMAGLVGTIGFLMSTKPTIW